MQTDASREALDEIVDRAGTDEALAMVIRALASAASQLADALAAPAPSAVTAAGTFNAAGDVQQPLDVLSHDLFVAALTGTSVRQLCSEEADGAITIEPAGRYAVAIDPLDGSSNCAINTPVGSIFSILTSDGSDGSDAAAFDGSKIVAAGLVTYGPATIMLLSIGAGVDVFHLDRSTGAFVRTTRDIRIPSGAREYAINASNYRHWDPRVRMYIDDLVAGADGPRGLDFNMRWFAAVAAEVYRIIVRGGIFLYPADQRPGYRQGRLRLVYEAHPIAFLIEQAGGVATDGETRILDKMATSVHERTPLVFGSQDKVERFAEYRAADEFDGERSPLFANRGLFRA